MSFLKRLWLKRLQALSIRLPAVYSSFVLFLVAIGYGFLLFFPLCAVISLISLASMIWHNPSLSTWHLSDWLLAGSLPVISVLCSYQSVHIFKAKLPLPGGRPLLREDFPDLFAQIDELRKIYRAPEIHHIKLNTNFAIKIVCTPKTGFPASCINTMLIGLPIMSCMSALHLRFLLAREIGHLSLRKRQPKRHVLYLDYIWRQYAEHYAGSWRRETFLLRLFSLPYAGLFSASVIPALRQECLVKDHCLFEITHSDGIAEAVVTDVVRERYLKEQFWPALNNKAFTEAKPPYLPYSTMGMVIDKYLNKARTQALYKTEIERIPELDSPIPNLRQRLLAIGYDDFVAPEIKTENAARHFLGNALIEIQKQMDNVWYLKNKSIWAMRYKRGTEEKVRLEKLHTQAMQSLLSNEEAHEYLLLVEKYVPIKKAVPYYHAILKTNSLDAGVCYDAGRLMLTAGDETGIKALQMAMDLSPDITVDSCQHIVDYLVKIGDTKRAQDYRRKIIEHRVES